MSPFYIYLGIVLTISLGCEAKPAEPEPLVPQQELDVPKNDNLNINITELLEEQRRIKISKRIQNTLKQVKQFNADFIETTARNNFLHTLYMMANSTAVTGQNVSRAAGTVIRGFVQDQFNLVSIAFYFPRLIFLDGPSQFIEVLRLLRTNQLQVPRDMDSAIDTLINFARVVRESQISSNLGTPFLSIFPNIFRGSELLATEVLYSVLQWLGPLNPADISSASVEGLWNRWDTKASTTDRYDYDKNNSEQYYSLRRKPGSIPGQQPNGGKA